MIGWVWLMSLVVTVTTLEEFAHLVSVKFYTSLKMIDKFLQLLINFYRDQRIKWNV